MGRETLWIAQAHNAARPDQAFEICGFLTCEKELHGSPVCGIPVLGAEDWVEGREGIAAVCAIGDPRARRKIVQQLEGKGVAFVALLHPSAQISEYVTLGVGGVISANAVVTTQVSIGNHVIINANATVSHDAVLEDFVTLAPGVQVTGGVCVEYGAELGANSVVLPRKRIGRGAVVGAGAVVTRDVQANTVNAGVPARMVRNLPAELWM